LSVETSSTENILYITAPDEMLSLIRKIPVTKDLEIQDGFATICLTCTGVPSFETQSQISKILEDLSVSPLKIQMSAMSVILFLEKEHVSKALEKLHALVTEH
jgi:aspartokinase